MCVSKLFNMQLHTQQYFLLGTPQSTTKAKLACFCGHQVDSRIQEMGTFSSGGHKRQVSIHDFTGFSSICMQSSFTAPTAIQQPSSLLFASNFLSQQQVPPQSNEGSLGRKKMFMLLQTRQAGCGCIVACQKVIPDS